MNVKLIKSGIKKSLAILGLLVLIIVYIFINHFMENLSQDEIFIVNIILLLGAVIDYTWIDDKFSRKNPNIKKFSLFIGSLSWVLYLFGDGMTSRICFMLLSLVAVCIFYLLSKQEEELNLIKLKLRQKENEYEYKMGVCISLNWNKILEEIDENEQLIKALWKKEKQKDVERIYENSDCLFISEKFSFLKFYNSKTNISTVWSDYNKKFLNEIIVVGSIFPDNTPFAKILSEILDSKNYQPQFRITPHHIGFSTWVGSNISEIPFRDIVSLLLEIGKSLPGKEMNGIKKFPLFIQNELEQNNVRYFTNYIDREDTSHELRIDDDKFKEWADENGLILSKNKADCHIFETDFFSIYITLECHFSEESIADVWG